VCMGGGDSSNVGTEQYQYLLGSQSVCFVIDVHCVLEHSLTRRRAL
jgi:hypothetical protein